MSTSVTVDTRPDGVAVLTFDQPGGKANVLTTQTWSDFEAAVDQLAGRSDVRGLVLRSAKPDIFIAGADLKLLGSAPGPDDPGVRAFVEQGLRTLAKLEALPVPTCAAVDGVALGGGLEVALACDCRIAGTGRVELGLPETNLGLIPGWGGTQRLPRIVGLETAATMLITGNPLTGATLTVVGLIETVVASADLLTVAANVVAATDPQARRDQKRQPVPEAKRRAFRASLAGESAAVSEAVKVMLRGAELPLAEGIALETEAFLRLAGSPESKRLIAAFFAGRKKS
jgi:enoyl-CoA hydratase/carnithine racemase